MFREIHLLDQYLSEKRKGSFNVLVDNENSDPKNSDSVSIPQWMFGTEIYKASGIMKTIQYVWEQNVVRIWNDEILTVPSELSDKKKGISEQS